MLFRRTEVRQQAVTLLRSSARNADVARRLNVPLGTVSYWKHMDRTKRGECPGKRDPKCPRCDGRALVRNASGTVVWDNDAYDFLEGDAPETANTSLWRQSRLTRKQGLYKVTDRIYQVRGLDLSNMTIVEGDRGIVVIGDRDADGGFQHRDPVTCASPE